MSLYATPSQTVGPYLHIGLNWLDCREIAGPGVAGERIAVRGRLLDGNGRPINDGLIEIWQANAQGRYAHPEDGQEQPAPDGFKGFGRIPTDDTGAFGFSTIKPGRVAGPGGTLQAPHLVVSVFARGVLKRLATRMYFPDDPANREDAVLTLVPEARRGTLIARRGGDGVLEWNVVIQGPAETVFFDV